MCWLLWLFQIRGHTLRSKLCTAKSHRNPRTLSVVCDEFAVDRSKFCPWANRFRGGCVSINNDQRSGRPRTSTDERRVKLVANVLEKTILQIVKDFLEPREQNLRRKMHKNRPQLLVAEPLILQDNARPHITLCDYGWEMFLMRPTVQTWVHQTSTYPQSKREPICGRRFSPLEELSTDGTRAIRHMNKSGVLDGIIMLPKRWDSVIGWQGNYIEGLWRDDLNEIKVLIKKYRVHYFRNGLRMYKLLEIKYYPALVTCTFELQRITVWRPPRTPTVLKYFEIKCSA